LAADKEAPPTVMIAPVAEPVTSEALTELPEVTYSAVSKRLEAWLRLTWNLALLPALDLMSTVTLISLSPLLREMEESREVVATAVGSKESTKAPFK